MLMRQRTCLSCTDLIEGSLKRPHTMGYSYARFKKTLKIFRIAEQGDEAHDDSENIDKLFREKRPARNSCFGPGLASVFKLNEGFSDDEMDDDDDDEEFDPSGKTKKLLDGGGGSKNRRAKRKAEDAPEGEKAAKAAKNSTKELSKEERRTDRIAFMSLMLASDTSRGVQETLARKHRNNVKEIVFEHVDAGEDARDRRTYFDQLDQEAALISNEEGRVLRNRKVAEIMSKCPRCKCYRENCRCHEALIERSGSGNDDNDDEQTLRRRRVPSIVPVTHRASNAQSTGSLGGISTPTSVKGKERAASFSPPPGVLTPPPTISQSSSFSKPRSSFSHCTTPGCNEHATSSKASPPPSSHTSFSSRNLNQSFLGSPSPAPNNAGASKYNPIVFEESQADMYAEEITLRTRWSHPINFRYANKKLPCKFCQNFRYGVFGEVERKVKVIKDPTSATFQYIEIAGDEKRKPDETRMCLRCAFDRLYILDCPSHVYKPLDEPDRDAKPYLDHVMKRNGPPARQPLAKMCSLCPLRARVKCCAGQKHDKMRREIVKPNANGCGLYLCGFCRLMVSKIGGTMRKRHIDNYVEQHNAKSELKRMLRADAEFLFNNSLLQKAYPSKKQAVAAKQKKA